jgi:BlaI family transcriptional regulator, penicillinase repressor
MRLTGAEWHVMNALWREWPATAREIEARLPEDIDWAYTTVRSMLARLNEKGALKEYKRSSVSFYEPLLSKRKARMATLQSVVGDAFEGAFGPLMHFLVEEEALSDAEKQKLLDVLTKKEGEGADSD